MVKCLDCGYLCVLKNSEELVEVPQAIRNDWSENQRFWQNHDVKPICFVRALPTHDRKTLESGSGGSLRIIQAYRDCPRFMEWNQGLSPKEHYEMEQQTRLVEWQQSEAEKQRAWQDEQKRKDQERADRLETDRDKRQQEALERESRLQDQRIANDRQFQKEQKKTDRIFHVAAGVFIALWSALLSWLLISRQSNPPASPEKPASTAASTR